MQIVLLCGGEGKRLKSLESVMPKGMMRINGKPFFDYLLNSLKTYKFNSIHICLGYKSEFFIDFLKNYQFDIPISYTVETGSKLLGTGGAIRNSLDYLNDNFIVQYGDTILDINYEFLFNFHLKNKTKLTMSVIPAHLCDHEPNVFCKKDNNGNLKCIYKKSTFSNHFNYIDYGAMVLKKEIFNSINLNKFDLSLIQETLTSKNQSSFLEVSKPFIEIGTPKSFFKANLNLKDD